MKRSAKPALTRQTWLEELGRRLVWYFSAAQVQEILSDYAEQFDEGHDHCKTQTEIIQALGTPAEAAALLLEEEPSARRNGLWQTALRAGLLALCCVSLWVCLISLGLLWAGVLLGLPLVASALFLLLRGPARVALEDKSRRRVSPAAVYGVPAVLTLAGTVEKAVLYIVSTQILSRLPGEELDRISRPLRYGNVLFWTVLMLALALLALWLLVRSAAVSIWYFPGVIHALGALCSAFFQFAYFTSVYIEGEVHPAVDILLRLLPYCAGLATALTFQRWVDGRRPLPRCFRDGEVSWPDWRHRLGVSLLGWYDAPQTIEVLEDYQEQVELAREQGKTDTDILSGMGRSGAVVRDLLKEDRKARLRRRRTWVWVVLAGLSGWLLLGLFRSFEFGHAGFLWFYSQNAIQTGLVSLVLGTLALFFLLHIRERAAVERRFPALRKPTAWIYVLPPVCSAVVEGLVLWSIYGMDHRAPVFLGLPLTWYMILSIEFSSLLLALLLIWTLARCVSGSIQHFPALPLIAGSFSHVLCVGIYMHSMDVSEHAAGVVDAVLSALIPLLAGLLLAIASWLVLRSAGKKEG